MFKIDNSSAATVIPTPEAVGPKPNGFFTNGNPGSGTPATIVDADWLNAVQEEISGAAIASGLTLSKTDRAQLIKSIANHATVGDYFAAGGSANAYTLSAISPRYAPTAYFTGMRVRFIAGFTNTAAATINCFGLGAKDIKFRGNIALYANAIEQDCEYDLYYNGTYFVLPDRYIKYGFFANFNTVSPPTVPLANNADVTLSFTNVLHNLGGGYSAGEFTALFSGMYGFNACAAVAGIDNPISLVTFLKLNNTTVILDGSQITNITAAPGGPYSLEADAEGSYPLTAGDKIKVITRQVNNLASTFNLKTDISTFASATLLYRT